MDYFVDELFRLVER